MAPRPRIVEAPDQFWRVGWRTNPGSGPGPTPLNMADTRAGNRFDAIDASFAVIYAADSRYTALLEAVAPLRPDRRLDHQVGDWAERGFMLPGSISAEWRNKRVWAGGAVPGGGRFLDLHAPGTLAWMNDEARAIIAAFDLRELTLAHIVGDDRSLTRTLATWLHHKLLPSGDHQFDGLRFESKHGSGLECWAIFDRTAAVFGHSGPIRLSDPEVACVEADLGVKFH
ncbi:MAG TPA: RES family NAD+ phosphorylase [Iamia sp.]